jgi:hypothetical protein
VGTIVGRRLAEQFEAFRLAEFPEDVEVGEAFNIGETGLEFGKDLEGAFGLVFGAEAFGDFGFVFVGALDESDGFGGEHVLLLASSF